MTAVDVCELDAVGLHEEEADQVSCTPEAVGDHRASARDVAVKGIRTSQPCGARSIGRDDHYDLMRVTVQVHWQASPFRRR